MSDPNPAATELGARDASTLRQRNPAGPAGLRCGPLMVFAAAVNRGLGSRTGAGRVSRELPTEPGPPRALKPPFSRSREKGRFHHGLLALAPVLPPQGPLFLCPPQSKTITSPG